MKVDKIDMVWAAVSMVIVAVSYRKGRLIDGLLLIYGLMAVIFLLHIFSARKRLKNSITVTGTVTGYHVSKTKKGYFPIVKYETKTRRDITSVYTVVDREQRYEIGDEVFVCYDADDPMSFYFENRESELTSDYVRNLAFGGILAAMLLIVRIMG